MTSAGERLGMGLATHLGFLGYATAVRSRMEAIESHVGVVSGGTSQSAGEKQELITPEQLAAQVRMFHDQKSIPPEQAEAFARYIRTGLLLPQGMSKDDTGEGIDVESWAQH